MGCNDRGAGLDLGAWGQGTVPWVSPELSSSGRIGRSLEE